MDAAPSASYLTLTRAVALPPKLLETVICRGLGVPVNLAL